MKRIRRALLFMPGDSRRKIEKGAAMDVDSIIMDLEDAIALNQKEAARESVALALREVDFGRSEALVRTNQVIQGWLYKQDIEVTVDSRPDGYVLPKIEEAWQVKHVSDLLTEAEQRNRWHLGSIKILAIIETAKGVVNLKEIATSDKRLDALIFGAEDFTSDLGAIRTEEGHEIYYARNAVVTFAKAFNLQAIDTVFVDLTADPEKLKAETDYIRKMGYTGKLAIHPKQVAPIQDVYTPTDEEIERARKLLVAFNEQQASGTGVFQYEGKMLDMPMVRAAINILHLAKACGIIDDDVPMVEL